MAGVHTRAPQEVGRLVVGVAHTHVPQEVGMYDVVMGVHTHMMGMLVAHTGTHSQEQ